MRWIGCEQSCGLTNLWSDCLSAMLEELIASSFGGSWRELLGEFQLAFVLFLQLSSLAALEQWKQVRKEEACSIAHSVA